MRVAIVPVAFMRPSSAGGVTLRAENRAMPTRSLRTGSSPEMLDSERPFGEHVCAEQPFASQVERMYDVNIVAATVRSG